MFETLLYQVFFNFVFAKKHEMYVNAVPKTPFFGLEVEVGTVAIKKRFFFNSCPCVFLYFATCIHDLIHIIYKALYDFDIEKKRVENQQSENAKKTRVLMYRERKLVTFFSSSDLYLDDYKSHMLGDDNMYRAKIRKTSRKNPPKENSLKI